MGDDFLTFGPAAADIEDGMNRQPALDPAISLAEYAARTAEVPEPVGRTLRAAAERGFTGELMLSLGTGVRVFLDDGRPYLAERVGDAPLGQRLVSLGALTDEQRNRGRVLVGDVEHVGRLFDRDPSIDRDAVVAAVEVMTNELLADIARGDASVTVTPYRHHASGVHRWFVGPAGAASQRPVDEVAPLDSSMFGRLAETDRTTPAAFPAPEPPIQIEWDLDDGSAEAEPVDTAGASAVDPFAEFDLDAEWERFDAARTEAIHGSERPDGTPVPPPPTGSFSAPPTGSPFDAPPSSAPLPPPPPPSTAAGPADHRATDRVAGPVAPLAEPFSIVWPDGSIEPTVRPDPERIDAGLAAMGLSADDETDRGEAPAPAASSASPPPAPEASAPPVVESPAPTSPGASPTSPAADVAPLPVPDVATGAGSPPSFTMPALELDHLPAPDAQVPDDVAEAVRRALAAIERAAIEPEVPARLRVGRVELPDFSMPRLLGPDQAGAAGPERPATGHAPRPSEGEELAAPVAPEAPIELDTWPDAEVVDRPPVSVGAFAPPSADTSAEVMYAREATAYPAGLPEPVPADPVSADSVPADEARPAPGQASVVFVDDDADTDDRRGALRRLIGSLRRSK